MDGGGGDGHWDGAGVGLLVKMGLELGLDAGMVKVRLTAAQLRLTNNEDNVGIEHGDGGGGDDYPIPS